MRDDMARFNWDSLQPSDALETWEDVLSLITNSVKRHIPLSKPHSRPKKIWFTSDVITSLKLKRKAWNKYKRNMTNLNYEDYHIARNNATKVQRNAHRHYEKQVADDIKTNTKNFWRYVKSKTQKDRHCYFRKRRWYNSNRQ
ncbi:hypothetical protein SNE40_012984 [Patella caerulea]